MGAFTSMFVDGYGDELYECVYASCVVPPFDMMACFRWHRRHYQYHRVLLASSFRSMRCYLTTLSILRTSLTNREQFSP